MKTLKRTLGMMLLALAIAIDMMAHEDDGKKRKDRKDK